MRFPLNFRIFSLPVYRRPFSPPLHLSGKSRREGRGRLYKGYSKIPVFGCDKKYVHPSLPISVIRISLPKKFGLSGQSQAANHGFSQFSLSSIKAVFLCCPIKLVPSHLLFFANVKSDGSKSRGDHGKDQREKRYFFLFLPRCLCAPRPQSKD